MPLILVSPLSAMLDALDEYHPSHLVTLLSPEFMITTPEGFPAERHLRLALNDVADPALGGTPPLEDHVLDLIEFSHGWTGTAPLLVHCWAGVSRSMAAAFTILCERSWPGAEHRIAREIRARAPHASPNRLLVRLADDALGRKGRMVEAVEAMGPCNTVQEGEIVEFPLDVFGL
ncbi:MAG: tyrosine protein phosphatase [Alphaproteobacteria bacterium]|nr:tyrosine protein phosphatase [Alphaproteobacteria bacterium]